MVSCGLEYSYTGGCEGGSGYHSMKYLEDYGSTIVGCWPSSSGGGNALEHFDSHGNEVHAALPPPRAQPIPMVAAHSFRPQGTVGIPHCGHSSADCGAHAL